MPRQKVKEATNQPTKAVENLGEKLYMFCCCWLLFEAPPCAVLRIVVIYINMFVLRDGKLYYNPLQFVKQELSPFFSFTVDGCLGLPTTKNN